MATHQVFAMRINGEERISDDAEHEAARHVLDVMRRLHVDNGMIVVTRWFGGRHLEAQRFKHIVSAAEQACRVASE